ncbi:MAG: hypothetical protein ACK4UN_12490, partial [Limisphaerales bacterium]
IGHGEQSADTTGSLYRAAPTVTVNNQPTHRKGDYFRAELAIGNSSSVIHQGITNLAVLNDSPNADIITNSTGNVLLAKTPETFLHDFDGNLTRDGLWTNVWNGENRLIRTESLSALDKRLEWGESFDQNRKSFECSRGSAGAGGLDLPAGWTLDRTDCFDLGEWRLRSAIHRSFRRMARCCSRSLYFSYVDLRPNG